MTCTDAPTRFHTHTCSRCQAEIGPADAPALSLRKTTYRPMPEGPEYEAVGDWSEPEGLGITLCGVCVDALAEFVFGVVIPL